MPDQGIMDANIFHQLLSLLAACVLVIGVIRRLNFSPIIGYIVVGTVMGPYGLAWISDVETIRLFAEFGIVFLLFTIGLEFSLAHLVAMKGTLLKLGGSQVLICTTIAWCVARWIGISAEGAFVIAGAIALSSTAIVSKQLSESSQLHTPHGRLTLSVLVFQDLATVPFLIIIIALGQQGTSHSLTLDLTYTILKGALGFIFMLLAGRWLLRPVLREVAKSRSSELFMLAIILIAIGAAFVTELLDLSMAYGAFLAGVVLGETEYKHQITASIRPFQDVLLGLFFISIGMLLNLTYFIENWYWVLLLLIAILLGKTVIVTLLAKLTTKTETATALRTGLILAQGGELGFALISLAISIGFINVSSQQIVLAAIILSMTVTPFIIEHSLKITHCLLAPFKKNNTDVLLQRNHDIFNQEFSNHVILCGYGRVGQNLAYYLSDQDVPSLALDLDPVRVSECKLAGENILYGDSTDAAMLLAAGLRQAQLLVITFTEHSAILKILHMTQKLCPNLKILVRTRDDAHLEEYRKSGATEVVPEVFEASLSLAGHLLLLLGVPGSRVLRVTRNARENHYESLKEFFKGNDVDDLEEPDSRRERLRAITLPSDATSIGQTLHTSLLSQLDILVTALRRNGVRGATPDSDTIIEANDVIILYGTPEDLEKAERLLLGGKVC